MGNINSTRAMQLPEEGKSDHIGASEKIQRLGGVLSPQGKPDYFCRCTNIAESACCNLLTLKTFIVIISILDIIVGFFYIIEFIAGMTWDSYYSDLYKSGRIQYFYFIYYMSRLPVIFSGTLGIFTAIRIEPELAFIYVGFKFYETFFLPSLHFLTIIDEIKGYHELIDILIAYIIFDGIRFLILFYCLYIAYSY